MAATRKIFIGDVHGCGDELEELLSLLAPQANQDQVYFTGDLLGRGPDPKKVFDLFLQVQARAVLGNHELHLIRVEDGLDLESKWSHAARADLREAYPRFLAEIRTWPLWIEEEDFLLVHAGLQPGLHPDKTQPRILTNIRTWDGQGQDIKNPANPSWYEFYQGNKLVIFGHWAALEGLDSPQVIGLDTGCVYGKKLTALILPERRLVSVKAHKAHSPIKGKYEQDMIAKEA